MQKTSITHDINVVSDSLKGQKISAALYLVTNHLSDNDPIKAGLRRCAVALLESSTDRPEKVQLIINLLQAAALAHIVSEQNVTILIQEITRYVQGSTHPKGVFGTLFDGLPEENSTISSKTKQFSSVSYMTDRSTADSKSHSSILEIKNKRQNQILTFINMRKSAGIKDIAALFPDVSEKTIQRELGVLVESGKITKRGSKRWSLYMTVGVK